MDFHLFFYYVNEIMQLIGTNCVIRYIAWSSCRDRSNAYRKFRENSYSEKPHQSSEAFRCRYSFYFIICVWYTKKKNEQQQYIGDNNN